MMRDAAFEQLRSDVLRAIQIRKRLKAEFDYIDHTLDILIGTSAINPELARALSAEINEIEHITQPKFTDPLLAEIALRRKARELMSIVGQSSNFSKEQSVADQIGQVSGDVMMDIELLALTLCEIGHQKKEARRQTGYSNVIEIGGRNDK